MLLDPLLVASSIFKQVVGYLSHADSSLTSSYATGQRKSLL